ncbi:hypothetical protein PS732_04450 [Pseudomonas fluorescens]|uniref:Uncharacterized protein n=1 Tax=Pseudomonas fluorescens TaxID=294 RepID=A0ABD7VL58_PSEFL|nr:hypothetical protein PS732_04450 [Pseudomonas fluorescens]
MVALNSRNTPPNSMIRSRPEKLLSNTSNSGCVRVTSQEILANKPRRMINASDRPMIRARSRWCGGSLSARIAMNTRLSIPSTSSSTIKVNKPNQAVGSANHSIKRLDLSSVNSGCRTRQSATRRLWGRVINDSRVSENRMLRMRQDCARARGERASYLKTGRLREGVHVNPE